MRVTYRVMGLLAIGLVGTAGAAQAQASFFTTGFFTGTSRGACTPTTAPDFITPRSLVPAKIGPPGGAAIVVAKKKLSCVHVVPPSTDCNTVPLEPAPYTTDGARGSTTMVLPT